MAGGLFYPNQCSNDNIIGTKNATTKALTPVTLTDYYNFDGDTSDIITTGSMSKMEILGIYTAGSGETANSLEIIIESSDDRINWHRLLNESVSNGTSTLTQREFTIVQSLTYGTLGYDAESVGFTAGLQVTGAGGATGYIETDTEIVADTSGTLLLSNITGVFVNDEALTDSGSGAATVNGILTSITRFSLPLDISNAWHRVSFKETGVASNAGTIYANIITSGR